jgi:hypothetical protein
MVGAGVACRFCDACGRAGASAGGLTTVAAETPAPRFSMGREKWRLLLPGASEPRLKVRTLRALIEAIAPLTRRDVLPHSCRLQL